MKVLKMAGFSMYVVGVSAIVNYLCSLVPAYLFLPIAITLAALGGNIYGTIEANEHD